MQVQQQDTFNQVEEVDHLFEKPSGDGFLDGYEASVRRGIIATVPECRTTAEVIAWRAAYRRLFSDEDRPLYAEILDVGYDHMNRELTDLEASTIYGAIFGAVCGSLAGTSRVDK